MNRLKSIVIATVLCGIGAMVEAQGPPRVVIEQCEFLPSFANIEFAQVTSVNSHGDFCGYIFGTATQEFEYYGAQMVPGGFSMIPRALNDAGLVGGDSSATFPPAGYIRDGSFALTFGDRSFTGINNSGWIVGAKDLSNGGRTGIRRDELGEMVLPGTGLTSWEYIDDEGTAYGWEFAGVNEHILLKTRHGDVRDLGTFGGAGARALHVNSRGDLAGYTAGAGENPPPQVGLAVIAGEVRHIPSETNNNAAALAVTLDGQIIGTDRSICSDRCHGKVWVMKNGVRFDLATEIAATLHVTPDFVDAFAANENGWIIARGFNPADNTYRLIRIKIEVVVDTDGDALLDSWEAPGGGIDVNHDGVIDLCLYDLGARPDHKDLFVEVDAGTIPMSDVATSQVLFAFDNAPVENPDGVTGIRLHTLRDENGILFPNARSINGFPEGFAATKAQNFGTVLERQDSNAQWILKAKAKVFRYCALYDGIEFVGQQRPYNGIGELGGNDFAIDVLADVFHDGSRDDDDVAATFMHELGHTLGLRHGGSLDSVGPSGPTSFQGKPNYPSIMNYSLAHPMRWSRRFWTLDYCREELGTMHEDSLDESAGIRSTLYRGYSMPYGAGPDLAREFRLARLDGRGIDFDSDGAISNRRNPVQEDLNFLPVAANISGTQNPSPGDVMHGNNDWANLTYRVVADEREFEHDITIAEGCPSGESIAFLDAAIPAPCFADFNDDGLLDFFDYLDFVAAFASGAIAADFNSDQIVDFFDYLDFVLEFAGGC